MSFKEAIEEDMEIFFNLDEFADNHRIDGVQMPLVIDVDKLDELKKNYKDADIQGIYKAKLIFHVKKRDFGRKPAIDAIINVDDRDYRVINSMEDAGVITVILGWYEE